MKRVRFRIPEDLYNQAEEQAERDNTTLRELSRLWLEGYATGTDPLVELRLQQDADGHTPAAGEA